MSDLTFGVHLETTTGEHIVVTHAASPPAFADGPVADTAETVTPQAGIVGAEPDGDDGDTMPHG